MGRGNWQVHVTYEICLRITPTLNQGILQWAGVLLLEQHARQSFPDDRRLGRWLLALLRRRLLSHCRTAAEDREGDRCSDPQRDKRFATRRHELIRAARQMVSTDQAYCSRLLASIAERFRSESLARQSRRPLTPACWISGQGGISMQADVCRQTYPTDRRR
jgi:hypothetical protein